MTAVGGNLDKRRWNRMAVDQTLYVREVQEEVWEGDDMFARIIEQPALEMTRAGFELTISDSPKKTYETDEPGNDAAEDLDPKDPKDPTARTDAVRSDFVRRVPGGWAVFGHSGKRLSRVYKSKTGAAKRLGQIEYFKQHGDARADAFPPPSAGVAAATLPPPPGPPPPKPIETERSTKPVEDAVLARYEEMRGPELFLEALLYEAAYGGAAILLGTNDGNDKLTDPLDTTKIKTFDWANVLTPRELQAVAYYGDPGEPKYGQPMIYRAMPDINMNVDMSIAGAAKQNYDKPMWITREIHESRLIVFPGIIVSKRHRYRRHGWGNSVLVRIWQVLQDFHTAYGAAAHLMADFAQAVIKIKGLADLIFQNDDDAVGKRAQLIDLSRSVARAVVLDADEEFERKATPVTGLPELLQRLEQRLAAAADRPVSVLFGREPSGLGSTGDMEMEQWRLAISARQVRHLKPRLERFLRMIMLAKNGPCKGKEPEDWSIEFNPLSSHSETVMADVRLKTSQADVAYITAGVLTPEEVAKSRFGGPRWSAKTTLDPDSREQAVADHEQASADHAKAQLEVAKEAAKAGSPAAGASKIPAPKPPVV